MGDETQPHPSILTLLDKRKAEGWSVEARAILFSEWMTHSLYIIENDKFPSRLPQGVLTHAGVAERMRTLLSQAEEHHFVGSKKEKYNFVERMAGTIAGSDKSKAKVAQIKILVNEQYDQSYPIEHLMGVLSGSIPTIWGTISEMEMDEEDFTQYVSSKIPQAHSPSQEQTLDRLTELEVLKQQMTDCDIPAMMFDALTFESASSLRAINSSLEKTKKAYQTIDAPTVCGGKMVVSFCQPYAEGNSGYMDSTFTNNSYMVSVSNQCGWDYSEVLTHEILHGHDALMGEHLDPNNGDMLSYLTKQDKHPLYKAWVELDHNVSSLQRERSLEEIKQLCREGIGKRWSSMGLASCDVEHLVAQWEQSKDESKDQRFLQDMQKLFSSTPFKESADFRSKVVLAECKLMDSMSAQAVFADFTKQFDGLVSLDEGDTYGQGYFEHLCEKMARSIQLVLDEVDKDTPFTTNSVQEELSTNNSFEKRWLVYPEQGHSSTITQYWRDFYNQDVVRDAYRDILKKTGVLNEDAPSIDVAPLNKQKLVQFKKDHAENTPSFAPETTSSMKI